jgi:hypothetical protein
MSSGYSSTRCQSLCRLLEFDVKLKENERRFLERPCYDAKCLCASLKAFSLSQLRLSALEQIIGGIDSHRSEESPGEHEARVSEPWQAPVYLSALEAISVQHRKAVRKCREALSSFSKVLKPWLRS